MAAIVVSEMKDRLSPKNDPPTMIAVMNAGEQMNPSAPPSASCLAIPDAIGTRATIVPTLVPIDIDMKHAARKSPAKMNFPGRIDIARFTVASMAPICFAVAAKAPAMAKIQIIRSTLLLPAPAEKVEIFSSRVLPLLIAIAYIVAIRNADDTGIA